MFIFPDDLLKKGQIHPFRQWEIPRNTTLGARNRGEEGNDKTAKSETLQQDSQQLYSTSIITLQDVFKIVEREKYPLRWKKMIDVISLMPTSASCEQSFSCLKHRLHENKNKRTAFNFVICGQHNSVVMSVSLANDWIMGLENPETQKGISPSSLDEGAGLASRASLSRCFSTITRNPSENSENRRENRENPARLAESTAGWTLALALPKAK